MAAYGGEECLGILKTVTPDLILLDIMMEPMDGWETLEKIKENPVTKDIPVLMLTAKQLTPTEAEEYGIFIEDYVLKPITHRELYDAIEHVLGRGRPSGPTWTGPGNPGLILILSTNTPCSRKALMSINA